MAPSTEGWQKMNELRPRSFALLIARAIYSCTTDAMK
jgi:hypothetical protein